MRKIFEKKYVFFSAEEKKTDKEQEYDSMDMDKDIIWPLNEMKSGEGGKYLQNSYFRADSYERFLRAGLSNTSIVSYGL